MPDLPELMGRHTCVTKLHASTPFGQFVFYPRDTVIGWSLALDGQWEPHETKALLDLIRPGDTVVDVGANLGWHSVQFAQRTGRDGRVLSFEPEPGNFALLLENLALNEVADSVVPRQLALLDRKGVVEFELSSFNYGDHRVRFDPMPAGIPDLYAEHAREVIQVKASTLDDALSPAGSRHEGRVRLAKLDCQGSEAAILLGGSETLRRIDYLATEYWPYGIRRSGQDPEKFLGILERSFECFARLKSEAGPAEMRPISELRSHAAQLTGNDEYQFLLLRSSGARP